MPYDVSREIASSVWSATKFLSGSTKNSVPFEIVYALRKALQDWSDEPCVITTALLDDQNFYFKTVDPSKVITSYLDVEFDAELIQIALPKLYRHRPLFNVALYHELGHFIDSHLAITKMTGLLQPFQGQVDQIHRKEHFADLFAASYAGHGISQLLQGIGPNSGFDQSSYTHPSMRNRIDEIDKFLNGHSTGIYILFNSALKSLQASSLQIRYSPVDVSDSFDNFRPYAIANEAELHGIMETGWFFLEQVSAQPEGLWEKVEEFERDRIINDLIEKSIRNRMITEYWTDGDTAPH